MTAAHQGAGMPEASPGMSRTFPPTKWQPYYVQQPMPRTRGIGNQLNGLTTTPRGVDPRLTAQGTWAPGRSLPPYVPMGYIDPRNVFSMRPA